LRVPEVDFFVCWFAVALLLAFSLVFIWDLDYAGLKTRTPKGSVTLAILIALAGLMGASGIILVAAGAHLTTGAGLVSAGYMMLFHATALLGGAALLQQGLLWRRIILVVLTAWVLGAALFSGDIALRIFTGHRLFAMAAPTGGIILIAGWLTLSVAAIKGLMRS